MLLVGRGGEGVVLASQLLADTFARAGFWVQSFPEFTAERRGAPIAAYLRWDEEQIHRRYKMRDCDILVVITPSPPSPETMARLRQRGIVVLNRETRFRQACPFEIARVPASQIAQHNGILSAEGRPMGNVSVLGACVRLFLPDGLEFLEDAIRSRMGARAEANVLAAREGYARCTHQHRRADDAPLEAVDVTRPSAVRALFPVSTVDSLGKLTGTWSLDRPVVLDACNACALCALFCPEGAITRSDGVIAIDYRHCKGCGICKVVCPVRNAIEMEAVPA
jgi:2-oxoacid:acceptor oxidoreductase gamma subunit (pyruvate/2-ketoisovalerate family)/2-oxoacid:acceptor oxidoreductase delta subunit (pyruvate/2-ketoisovalerate family)